MRGAIRLAVVRRVAAPVVVVGVMVSSLTLAAPAQAAQEVYRTHPCFYSLDSGPDCGLRDTLVTLVKYYDIFNGVGKYQVCVYNYHHTGVIYTALWAAKVRWFNDIDTNFIEDSIPLPGPGAGKCTQWRALHGYPFISYKTSGETWWHWDTGFLPLG